MFSNKDGNISKRIIGHGEGRDACNAKFSDVILGSYWGRQIYCHIYFLIPNLERGLGEVTTFLQSNKG